MAECSRQNALVRGSARHRRLGYPEGVLTVRRGKLHRQQRPLWSRSARWHFKLFSPLFAFCGPSGSGRPKGRISRSAPIPTAKIRREGPLDPLKGCGNYGSGAWSATRVVGNKVTKNRVWNRTTGGGAGGMRDGDRGGPGGRQGRADGRIDPQVLCSARRDGCHTIRRGPQH